MSRALYNLCLKTIISNYEKGRLDLPTEPELDLPAVRLDPVLDSSLAAA